VPQPSTDVAENETVKVRNVSRRALMIAVPGEPIHLLPGAVVEVPRGYLATGELAMLLRAQTVVVLPLPAPAPAPSAVEADAVVGGAGAADAAQLRPPRKNR